MIKQAEYFELEKRQKNYNKLKQELINNATNNFGDIFSDASLSQIPNLSNEYFSERFYQQTALPYSNDAIAKFIKMPKRPIHQCTQTHHGKNVYGSYLLGQDQSGKKYLFALSVIQDKKFKNHFSIKLDICPQGKTWLNLVRIDNNAPAHPNYIKNGELVKQSEVEFAETPHLHIASEQAQVLFHDDPNYSTATNIESILNKQQTYAQNDNILQCLDYFLDFVGVQEKTNQDFLTSQHSPLFDYNDLWYDYLEDKNNICNDNRTDSLS